MTIGVLRLENPAVLDVPMLRDFTYRAMAANKITRAEAATDDLKNMAGQDQYGIFYGFENGEPKAFALAILPTGPFIETVQVVCIYNEGKDTTGKLLIEKMLDFARAAGYNRAWGINRSGHSNEAMQRLWGYVGFVHEAGTIMEYDF